jgi:pilus assembly protein TadC
MPSTVGFWILGAAWGLVLAAPVARRSGHVVPAARARALGSGRPTRATGPRAGLLVRARGRFRSRRAGVVTRVVRSFTGRRRARATNAGLARDLPVAIDLLAVAVGAGCTPYLALDVARRWAPASVAAPMAGVLRSCALGSSFDAALEEAAHGTPVLRPIADALLTSDRLGAPVGPVLARLADEERTALRRAAETHARRIPVRLLFPLVFLVLPAFVLLTVVPGLAAGLGRL